MRLTEPSPKWMVGQNLYDVARDYLRFTRRRNSPRRTESDAEMLATQSALARRMVDAGSEFLRTMEAVSEGRCPGEPHEFNPAPGQTMGCMLCDYSVTG